MTSLSLQDRKAGTNLDRNSSWTGAWRKGGAWLAGGTIVLAGLLVYGRSVGFAFLGLDDPDNILRNPWLNPPSWAHVGRFWREPYLSLYVPLTYSWWSLEAILAWPTGAKLAPGAAVNFDPRVFHAGSVLLHVLGGLSAFALLKRLFRSDLAACFGALLFLLHPLQAESVGWVTENKGLLSSLFSLVALWQYVVFAQDATETHSGKGKRRTVSSRRWWHFGAATISFGLALLSKPSAAAVPLMAGTIDYGLVGRKAREIGQALAIWIVMAAGILWLTRSEQSGSTILFESPLWARPLIALDALAFYLFKLAVPLRLSPDYGRSLPELLDRASLWYSWLLPAIVAGAMWWLPRRRVSLAAFGLFVCALLPVLGLVPFAYQSISTVADRYAYLALIGPACLVAWLLAGNPRRWAWGASAAMLLVLGALSARQIGSWRNDESWRQRAMAANPRSIYAHDLRAQTLEREKAIAAALSERQLAVAENPKSLEALFSLAATWTKQDKPDEATRCYQRALEIYPGANIARAFLAESLIRRGDLAAGMSEFRRSAAGMVGDRNFVNQCTRIGSELLGRGRLVEAREVLDTALALRPQSIEALNNLAVLLSRQGDGRGALATFDRALAIDPAHVATLVNRGALLVSFGQMDRAIASFRQALALEPRNGNAATNLAIVLVRAGRMSDAYRAYEEALRIQPDWLEGQLQLSWLLATAPNAGDRNGAEATRLAEELCKRTTFTSAGALDALAAARAEEGKFADAVEWAQRAATIARQQKRVEQAQAIEARLALYRRKQPYREPPGRSLFP